LKTDSNFPGGREFLRRMLEKTGFKLKKKSYSKKMIVMERNDEVAQKAIHLRRVRN
jgi:hypothetical protein